MKNNILIGLTDHVATVELRKHLWDRSNEELRTEYLRNNKHDKLDDIADVDTWIDEVPMSCRKAS